MALNSSLSYLSKLEEKGFDVSYKKVGVGDRVVFTFTGVGMDERYFSKFFKEEEGAYTFYHFFINIKSYKHKSEIPQLWLNYISSLLIENNIKHVSIVAYSIGARLAYPLFGISQLDKTVLIVPDGVFEHPIYRLATKTILGGLLFYPVFKTLLFCVASLTKFIKISSKELFYMWKLYSVFKFPGRLPLNSFVFLASEDFICPSKYVLNKLYCSGFTGSRVVKSTHFTILPLIKKNILGIIK